MAFKSFRHGHSDVYEMISDTAEDREAWINAINYQRQQDSRHSKYSHGSIIAAVMTAWCFSNVLSSSPRFCLMLFLASFPISPVAATGEGKDQELQREMSTAEILEISTQLEKAKANERALTQRCKEQEQQIATLRRKVLKLTKVMSQLHQGFARLPLPPTLHRYHCCCCWHCRRRSAIAALLWTLLNPWQWWVLVLCPGGPSWAN